jgi:hypothetical protein
MVACEDRRLRPPARTQVWRSLLSSSRCQQSISNINSNSTRSLQTKCARAFLLSSRTLPTLRPLLQPFVPVLRTRPAQRSFLFSLSMELSKRKSDSSLPIDLLTQYHTKQPRYAPIQLPVHDLQVWYASDSSSRYDCKS